VFGEFLEKLSRNKTLLAKEKRFQAYKKAAHKLGYAGRRHKLPQCVERGIKDAFPEADQRDYVGYSCKKNKK
jgi:hypothetical protein